MRPDLRASEGHDSERAAALRRFRGRAAVPYTEGEGTLSCVYQPRTGFCNQGLKCRKQKGRVDAGPGSRVTPWRAN
jgi:hypothetical protein